MKIRRHINHIVKKTALPVISDGDLLSVMFYSGEGHTGGPSGTMDLTKAVPAIVGSGYDTIHALFLGNFAGLGIPDPITEPASIPDTPYYAHFLVNDNDTTVYVTNSTAVSTGNPHDPVFDAWARGLITQLTYPALRLYTPDGIEKITATPFLALVDTYLTFNILVFQYTYQNEEANQRWTSDNPQFVTYAVFDGAYPRNGNV